MIKLNKSLVLMVILPLKLPLWGVPLSYITGLIKMAQMQLLLSIIMKSSIARAHLD